MAPAEAKVGWLPQCILQELPEGQRWMCLGMVDLVDLVDLADPGFAEFWRRNTPGDMGKGI